MRIGILDIDTKKEKNNREAVEKYPNPACGKIFGYHYLQGDEIFYPWDQKTKVDVLYVSSIFSWTRKTITRSLPIWSKYAGEIHVGGSGQDDTSSPDPSKWIITDLPKAMKSISHSFTYKLYDIDYGIGKTSEGCGVRCGWCMVWRKEGAVERRVHRIDEIVNPKYWERNKDGSLKYPQSDHIVLMNNNSLADPGFSDDIDRIKELNLSVHWDQANDITLMNDEFAAMLKSVNYRDFTGKRPALYFAADTKLKIKLIPVWAEDTNGKLLFDREGVRIPVFVKREGKFIFDKVGMPVPMMNKTTHDMMKVIPEKVALMREYGIFPSHLNWYMLIGFDPSYTVDDDIERFNMLNDLGCDVFAMKFRDLNGKIDVDGTGKRQKPHIDPFRRWINGHAFRNVKFKEFHDFIKRDTQIEWAM